ncbi:PREDICTED: uncharacterized protein LOC106122780 [Papilio xuthus]|uniref:Uncharacterized protein LOC106122780 n=1 Tax=Papilio xuthus TaxID=66420 RepID=A0AAJ6ZK83_PAPXU|nr:PREDICTED: uncharacterized protein LOC106122780 [Papilio xuthus]
MSSLSGYDTEAVGFDSVTSEKKAGTEISTQTNDFKEYGVGCQTVTSKDVGCSAEPEDLNAEDDVLKEYPPPGLNAFLRKVVPSMMEQLDQNEKDMPYNSSDSDEEEAVTAKILQEINVDGQGLGAGDHHSSILGVTWSSTGNTLAISIGKKQHETWCEQQGQIKVYTMKHFEGSKLTHALDIMEKNCVTVVKYHPAVSALLAYGTASGEVVLNNLVNMSLNSFNDRLSSPSGCHGSRRVSALHWADASLANTFLTMQINGKGKRRGAADQVLISSGCDGAINVWQVNANLKIFENVVCYTLNAGRKPAPDITCFDFNRRYCLRRFDEKLPDDIFVVGCKSGQLYLCKIKGCGDGDVDPVHEELEGHGTCVLGIEFSCHKPVFVSMSMDSELRVYSVNQPCPLKIFCLDVAISCMALLGTSPCAVVGLTADEKEALRVYNVFSGKQIIVDGFLGQAEVTCVAVSQSGCYRIVAGNMDNTLRVWEFPALRFKLSSEDYYF